MKKLNTIIVDNESHTLNDLANACHYHFPELKIIKTFNYQEITESSIEELSFDLLFFDLGYPNKIGEELVLEYQNLFPTYVVFTDSIHPMPRFNCDVRPVAYLTKPIENYLLYNVIQQIFENTRLLALQDQLNSLYSKVLSLTNPPVELPTMKGFELVEAEDIMYLESANNYTYVNLASGKKILVSKTLKSFEEILCRHFFLRVHKRFIVNLKQIIRYEKGDGGEVILKNGKSISVARNRKESFLRQVRALI